MVNSLLEYLQPADGCKMLDIACGEGRFSRWLAARGHDVTGIDISPEMVASAWRLETENLHFFIQDMRFPFFINYFDYAFNFFTSFGYFDRQEDHTLAAHSIAAALKPGGILVIDYLNARFVASHLVAGEKIQKGPYVFEISRKMEERHIVKDICVSDRYGKPHHYREQVAVFSSSDFQDMFGGAGMEIIATFGDYNLGPYQPGSSPRMILVFRKKHGASN